MVKETTQDKDLEIAKFNADRQYMIDELIILIPKYVKAKEDYEKYNKRRAELEHSLTHMGIQQISEVDRILAQYRRCQTSKNQLILPWLPYGTQPTKPQFNGSWE
jgi:hypothetical protein